MLMIDHACNLQGLEPTCYSISPVLQLWLAEGRGRWRNSLLFQTLVDICEGDLFGSAALCNLFVEISFSQKKFIPGAMEKQEEPQKAGLRQEYPGKPSMSTRRHTHNKEWGGYLSPDEAHVRMWDDKG